MIGIDSTASQLPTLAPKPTATKAGNTQRAARMVPLTTHADQNAAKLNRNDDMIKSHRPCRASSPASFANGSPNAIRPTIVSAPRLMNPAEMDITSLLSHCVLGEI